MSENATYQELGPPVKTSRLDSSFILHSLFGRFKFDFEVSSLFHCLAQRPAPFVRGVGRFAVVAAAHFFPEGDSGREDFHNFWISDHPCFAETTLGFPTFCESC